jgi:type IV pilus assembly protein PilE
MIVVALIAILARVALPTYSKYVVKSRARASTADLSGLALSLENTYQLTLAYPTYAAGTVATTTLFPAWSPTQTAYFGYTLTSAPTGYTLTATGSGTASGCNLTLTNAGAKTATSTCGFTTW